MAFKPNVLKINAQIADEIKSPVAETNLIRVRYSPKVPNIYSILGQLSSTNQCSNCRRDRISSRQIRQMNRYPRHETSRVNSRSLRFRSPWILEWSRGDLFLTDWSVTECSLHKFSWLSFDDPRIDMMRAERAGQTAIIRRGRRDSLKDPSRRNSYKSFLYKNVSFRNCVTSLVSYKNAAHNDWINLLA